MTLEKKIINLLKDKGHMSSVDMIGHIYGESLDKDTFLSKRTMLNFRLKKMADDGTVRAVGYDNHGAKVYSLSQCPICGRDMVITTYGEHSPNHNCPSTQWPNLGVSDRSSLKLPEPVNITELVDRVSKLESKDRATSDDIIYLNETVEVLKEEIDHLRKLLNAMQITNNGDYQGSLDPDDKISGQTGGYMDFPPIKVVR